MVVSITASAICCRASCCRSNSKAGQVYFQGSGQHPTLPQQHIELGGFPSMPEASVAVNSKDDLDRQGERYTQIVCSFTVTVTLASYSAVTLFYPAARYEPRRIYKSSQNIWRKIFFCLLSFCWRNIISCHFSKNQ